MSAAVGWDQIINGMVEVVTPRLVTSAPAPDGAYLRVLDWYAGEFASSEAMKSSGIAGRCPAVLMDFAGERVIRTMVGARKQFIESTFLAICASDSMRSRKDRETVALFEVLRDVRFLLHGKRLGLDISPLHFAGIVLVAKQPDLMAYAVQFTARHHIDFGATPPGTSDFAGAAGHVIAPAGSEGSADAPIHFTP